MKNLPKISVIVPVYNVEKYVARCIESILNQTYTNIELILVDDKTPDNSGKICDEYALRDERIRVIHREKNGGLSAARNSGLEVCNGEYVTFVDSDDFLHHTAVSVMYKNLSEYNADVSIINCIPVPQDIEGELADDTEPNVMCCNGRDILRERFKRCTSAWAKLYTTSLFDDLRFIEGRWHEDVHMSCRMFYDKAKTVVICDNQLYYACQNPQGFMHSKMSPVRIDDMLYIFEDRFNFFVERGACDELVARAANNYLFNAKTSYYAAKNELKDKERAAHALQGFKKVFAAMPKDALDADTQKIHAAFAKCPQMSKTYERIYWLCRGIGNAVKRRIRK